MWLKCFKVSVVLISVYLDYTLCFLHVNNRFENFILEINSIVQPNRRTDNQSKWIEQKLDHFDSNEKRTWNMRYFERLEYWKPKGPIYVFLGGEATSSPGLLYTGTMYELAKETNGAMYATEHRYYGESIPIKVDNTEAFKFLSAKQAMADIATLLKTLKLKASYNESKIVLVGGSYSGNLAAWMKVLYPELVDAAIASSGPVLAKKDFFEYLEKVNENYEHYGTPGCLDNIRKLLKKYDELTKTQEGIEKIKEEENICKNSDLTNLRNKQLFFLYLAAGFMYISQYKTVDAVKNSCHDLEALRSEYKIYNVFSSAWSIKDNCFDLDYDKIIEVSKNDSWTYQTCTEFGYFQTTTSDEQPFTKNVPLDFFIEICQKAFGPNFDEKRVDKGVSEVNELYGGLKPKVDMVVFTNGELDPWSKLGVLEDLSYDAPSVKIARSSHCRDLFSDRQNDPEELKEARKYVKYLIKKWIGAGEFYN